MKRFLKYFVVIVILVLAFLSVVWFYSRIESKTYTSPAVPVQVMTPEYRTIRESYTVTGYIEAEAMVPVVPFVQGTITEYYAENGMDVKKGQVLAVIDPEPYELQLKQAEAAYLAYESTFERVSSLYKRGAATEQNYDEVKAQRDAGKAQKDFASLQLSYCYVDSPIDGTILMTKGSVGSIGTNSEPIAVVSDLDNLIVNVSVPEKYYYEIEENKNSLKVVVSRSVEGKTYSANAYLVSVSPYIDPTTKTFSVKVKLKDGIEYFRPGMKADVTIVYRENNVLSLPQNVKKLDGSVYSASPDQDGSVRAKYLELPSLLSDDDYFQVEEKYRNTYFIVRGQTRVLDGEPVVITEGY